VRERLGELGIPVHTGDLLENGTVAPRDVNLYATMGLRTRYRRLARRGDTILSAFLVNECPVAEPRLFADLVDADAHFRRMFSFADDEAMRPYVPSPVRFRSFRFPYAYDTVEPEAWSRRDRRLLAIINANKVPRLETAELYTERMRAVAYFERFGEVDLYGVGWDGPPFRIGQTRVPGSLRRLGYLVEARLDGVLPDRDPLLAAARRAWRGAVGSKIETFAGYTFAICFENMVMQGWVTEKIFDCLVAGTIPVYLGAPDIDDWVDSACFIDMRQFDGYDELRAYLLDLGPTEIEAMRAAGRDYIGSEMFRPFSKEAFADLFVELVSEDAGVPA
jgi:hypothetical protein